MSRPSLGQRITRALVGLVTVWCLGCDGYDPIVAALATQSTANAASCESMPEASARSNTTAPTTTISDGSSEVSANSNSSGFECGCCEWCHALTFDLVSVAQFPLGTVQQMSELPGELASISRAPLIPPPQLTL